MTIATNNGVPIIRDGKVVTDCGCCGGWYCCPPADCADQYISTVNVTVLFEDVYFADAPDVSNASKLLGLKGSLASGSRLLQSQGYDGNYMRYFWKYQASSSSEDFLFAQLGYSGLACGWELDLAFARYQVSGSGLTVEQLWSSTPGSNYYRGTAASSNAMLPLSPSVSSFDIRPPAVLYGNPYSYTFGNPTVSVTVDFT